MTAIQYLVCLTAFIGLPSNLTYSLLPGSTTETRPPSLLITATGLVVHGPAASGDFIETGGKDIKAAPRVFSQSFILVPDEEASVPGEAPTYYITSDSLRFVG